MRSTWLLPLHRKARAEAEELSEAMRETEREGEGEGGGWGGGGGMGGNAVAVAAHMMAMDVLLGVTARCLEIVEEAMR